MTKEIKIGDKTERFSASGVLPITYRDQTGRDFFADVQAMSGGISNNVLDIAYAMYTDANPEDGLDEKTWLRGMNFADLNNAIPEIINLLAETQETTSEAKKKSDQ